MNGEYTIIDLLQNWGIREVCVDCKHLYQDYDYYPDMDDEEFMFFTCFKEHCVYQYLDKDKPCKDKEKGKNEVYDEERSKQWEEKQINVIKKFYIENLCPYCENNNGDCIEYLIVTDDMCKQCVKDGLEDIKHGECYLKIERVKD